MNKVTETMNGPAITMIHRAAVWVMCAVAIWAVLELVKHKDSHAVADKKLAVSLERLAVTLENTETRIGDRYTSTQAERDMKFINDRITTLASNISRQIDRVTDRVRDLERN